jgi:hypothetical protein
MLAQSSHENVHRHLRVSPAFCGCFSPQVSSSRQGLIKPAWLSKPCSRRQRKFPPRIKSTNQAWRIDATSREAQSATPITQGNRPSTAPCTSLGASNASEMTWRALHVSRAAICPMLVTAPVTILSSQRGRNDLPWLEESKNQRGSGDALDLYLMFISRQHRAPSDRSAKANNVDGGAHRESQSRAPIARRSARYCQLID